MQKLFKPLLVITSVVLLFACNSQPQQALTAEEQTTSKQQIAAMLDSFNVAAANASFDTYFNFFTADATFNGTDATENWDKAAFQSWAKPYFDKKQTWNFKPLQRKIYFGQHADIAWFEELLQTQMKICRGSGVVVKQNNQWKVQQYVLSTTVPNTVLDSVISLKAVEEDSLMNVLRK